MTQFRPTAPQTEAGRMALAAEYKKEVETLRRQEHERAMEERTEHRSQHWADVLGGKMRIEIDGGRGVQVVLPGISSPIEVDTAGRWLDLLVVRGPDGETYYVADPAGVVVICAPPRKLGPDEKPYWMQVDEPGWKPRKDR